MASTRLSADPFKYHRGSKGVWEKIRKALVVNPDINNGLVDVTKQRYPPPGSRPEIYAKPATKASDVADNQYFTRDARRAYPKLEVVTQNYLAELLIAAPDRAEQIGLPAPNVSASASKALAEAGSGPTLAALYPSESKSSSSATPKFFSNTKLPPRAPTRYQHKWTPGEQPDLPAGTCKFVLLSLVVSSVQNFITLTTRLADGHVQVKTLVMVKWMLSQDQIGNWRVCLQYSTILLKSFSAAHLRVAIWLVHASHKVFAVKCGLFACTKYKWPVLCQAKNPAPLKEVPTIVCVAPLNTRDMLNASQSLALHAAGLIVLYSLYGLLQERILKGRYGPEQEQFKSAPVLVLTNRVFSCAVGLIILLSKSRTSSLTTSFYQRIKPASPLYCYAAVALLNFCSTFCQYEALKYVSFTTQSLCKTIKMVPVLVMGSLVYKKVHKTKQWVAAGTVLIGAAVYLTSRPDPRSHTAPSTATFLDGVFGTLLLLGYLALDGLTSTTQEKVFGRNPNPGSPFADGSPVLDQMVWVNLSAICISLLGCAVALTETIKSIGLMLSTPALLGDVMLLSATSAGGLIVLLNTIAAFGALTSSTIMTVRQFLSILINAGVFGNFSSVGLQGWLGVMWVGSGVFIKMDRRFDEEKKPVQRNAPDVEKEVLMSNMSPEANRDDFDSLIGKAAPVSTPIRKANSRKQHFKQYGPPLLVPIFLAILLNALLPVFYGQTDTQHIWQDVKALVSGGRPLTAADLANGDDYVEESQADIQIEGGLWSTQLHKAIAPQCDTPEETRYYPKEIPFTALATYPRSGNTYIRGLLERATGWRTSSVYCDRVLEQTFLGECSDSRFLKKTHWPVTKVHDKDINGPAHWTQFDRFVLVTRNPLDAIYSYLHYQRTGHNHEDRATIGLINSTDRNALNRYASRWVMHTEYWAGAPIQSLHLRYEDLRSNPLPNLMSLLSFLLPAEELPPLEQLACVVQVNSEAEAYHSRKSAAFSSWDKYTPEMRDYVLTIVAPYWCRFGYDILLKQELNEEPVKCASLYQSPQVGTATR